MCDFRTILGYPRLTPSSRATPGPPHRVIPQATTWVNTQTGVVHIQGRQNFEIFLKKDTEKFESIVNSRQKMLLRTQSLKFITRTLYV